MRERESKGEYKEKTDDVGVRPTRAQDEQRTLSIPPKKVAPTSVKGKAITMT